MFRSLPLPRSVRPFVTRRTLLRLPACNQMGRAQENPASATLSVLPLPLRSLLNHTSGPAPTGRHPSRAGTTAPPRTGRVPSFSRTRRTRLTGAARMSPAVVPELEEGEVDDRTDKSELIWALVGSFCLLDRVIFSI